MAECADGIQPVILQGVFQVIAEIGIVIENRQIHQAVGAAWFRQRWIRRWIGRSFGCRPDRHLNSLLRRDGRWVRATSLRDKRRPGLCWTPQWFRHAGE